MKTSITGVPTGQGLESGPRIMVVPAEAGVAAVDLYRKIMAASQGCRANESAVALLRTERLNSPDRVAVIDSARAGKSFTVKLEIRRYDGSLAANDPWFALIEVDLGRLDQGVYQLVVEEVTLRFSDFQRPDLATDGRTITQRLDFNCL